VCGDELSGPGATELVGYRKSSDEKKLRESHLLKVIITNFSTERWWTRHFFKEGKRYEDNLLLDYRVEAGAG
jgi:hypothetical protein